MIKIVLWEVNLPVSRRVLRMLLRQSRPEARTLARVVAARLEKGCRWHCGGKKGPAEGLNVVRRGGRQLCCPGFGKQETRVPTWPLTSSLTWGKSPKLSEPYFLCPAGAITSLFNSLNSEAYKLKWLGFSSSHCL